MNKNLLLTLLMFIPVLVCAQRLNVLDELKADPKKAYGNDYPYLFQTSALTPAPTGYKPFYISHYGRHGSRYYWADNLYTDLDTLLTKAHAMNRLTSEGEEFRARFNDALPELKARWGELSETGWQQHKRIAHDMYDNFAEAFSAGGHVSAVSSLSGRCVISMSAFCLELQRQCPALDIREESSRTTLHAVVPDDRQNPEWRDYPMLHPRFEGSTMTIAQDTMLTQRIVARMLTSVEGLGRTKQQIADDMKNLYTSLVGIGHEGMMGTLYTDDDVMAQWETTNLGSYSWVFGPQMKMIPILEDILATAEDVINGTSKDVASLRFGHDGCLGPLTVLMGINGADLDPKDPNDVKYCYQNYETCKASNIQLVFYRSVKGGDILLKCLLNGSEATLPVPSDTKPYYRWDDFRTFYKQRIKEMTSKQTKGAE